jgi:hypothetical protein
MEISRHFNMSHLPDEQFSADRKQLPPPSASSSIVRLLNTVQHSAHQKG